MAELNSVTNRPASSPAPLAPEPPAPRSHAARKGDWIADLCLLATACMWGINIPIVKDATGRVDPFVFNAGRLTLATIALGMFAWWEARQQGGRGVDFTRGRFWIFAGLTGFLYMVLFMLGVSRTTGGNVALLLSSMPMWTAVFSYWFIGERLSRLTWIGLGITFLGTFAIVTAGQPGATKSVSWDSQYLWGNLLMIAAAMTWASGTLVSRRLLETVGPMQLAFASALVTTPAHIWLVAGQLPAELPSLAEPVVLMQMIYSGVFSTGLAYACWHIGVRQLGGSHASVYQNFVTLVAVVGSWLFLKETPLATQIAGGVLIIIGVLVMRHARQRGGRRGEPAGREQDSAEEGH